jgi:hypothetical protein
MPLRFHRSVSGDDMVGGGLRSLEPVLARRSSLGDACIGELPLLARMGEILASSESILTVEMSLND